MIKKILIGVVGLIVLLAVAVVAVPRFINWNNYKADIAEAVKSATGRDLAIDGNIDVSIFPDISFRLADVRLSNAPGAANQQMFSLGHVQGRLALFPLIGRKVEVRELIIAKPELHLEIDRQGRPNWVFAGAADPAKPAAAPAPASDGGGGLPISDLVLENVRLTDGLITFTDARTGQKITAKTLNIKAVLENFSKPFQLDLQTVLNEKPLTLKTALSTPGALLGAQRTTIQTSLDAPDIKLAYDGAVRLAKVPTVDGKFDLDVPSAGRLASWLGRPLPAGQQDPGRFVMRAEFEGRDARTLLKTFTLEGTGLQAQATGELDFSGQTRRVALNLTAGVLDLDRYLPPADRSAPPVVQPARRDPQPARTPMQLLPDDPIDLSALKQFDLDVKVAIGGIKAVGYEVGRIALDATGKNGVIAARLAELRLYGGNVTGNLDLNAASDALSLASKLNVDKVNVGALARAAQGADAAVTGIANLSLDAQASGRSPRALVRGMKAALTASLAGMDARSPAGTLSKFDLAVDLPGGAGNTSVKGSLQFNREDVAFSLVTDPLEKALSAEKWPLKLAVDSRRVKLGYDGALQLQPAPGADGQLQLDIPSVGQLLAWVGNPLPKEQPDPGPLSVKATFAGGGTKATLREATIDGKAIRVKATGGIDLTAMPRRFDADVEITEADLNAYLPPAKDTKPTPQAAPAQPAQKTPGRWSEDPIELSALRENEGTAKLRIGKLRYGEVDVQDALVTVAIDKGVLKAVVEQMKLAGGTLQLQALLDGSKQAAAADYNIKLSGVQARPVLKTFAGTDRLSGTLEFETDGKTAGANQKQLVEALNGKGRFMFRDGAIHGINIANTLRRARTLGFSQSSEEKTDFAELSGSYTIKDGVLENRDLQMLAPLVRLSGGGVVPMPPRTVDYKVEAKLVASLQGQGASDPLAGLPIPVSVQGSWDEPTYGVDWKSVFAEAAKDPQRLANMPKEFRDLGQNLGISLPGAGAIGGAGGALPSIPQLPGTGSGAPATGGAGGLLPRVLQPAPAAPAAPSGSTEEKKPETQTEQKPPTGGIRLPSIRSPF
ncbi:MAG: AsmA family protein [Alphaproteobacteria bacterium]|nr:AsmA family protein [Alphaproteobacteria bacterium]